MLILSCNRQKSGTHDLNSSDVKQSKPIHSKVRYRPKWLHQAQFAGVYVALEKGFYSNYGIEVELQPGGMEFPAAESIQKGTTDFTTLFMLNAMKEHDKGNHLVNLAQITQKSALMLVAKKSKGSNSIDSLRGKKIGLWHSDYQELSTLFIQKHDLKAEIVPISYSLDLFLMDLIDAVNVMVYNEYHQILQAGFDEEELCVFDFAQWGFNIPEDGIYCSEEFFQKNPKLARDFAEATMDGWLYAFNHEEEALAIVAQVMKQANIPVNLPNQRWMLKQMKNLILVPDKKTGVLSEADFISANHLLKTNGQISSDLDYRSFLGLNGKK
ncbi:MAG: ABC transporter substrate-binding protein [Candidatus Cloacimonetes bacterium]|nr:ABC transporter substrate-binding protein [Candidatus Cloacimonadota bacterium]